MKPVVYAAVVVNSFCNSVNELDDGLCTAVTRSRFCTENVCFLSRLVVRVFKHFVVYIHNVKNVHQLAFVFVKAFYLYVKNAVSINDFILGVFQIVCKAALVMLLNCNKFIQIFIASEFFKSLKFGKVFFPAMTDSLCDELRKFFVCRKKPAALCNTVSLVVEFFRIQLVPVAKLLLLKKASVKLCNTVYAETCVNCKPSHIYFSVIDDGHTTVFCIIVRIFFAQLNHKAAVDFFNNLIDTRKKTLENLNRPFFKRFCKNCVVCISKCVSYYVPGIVPAYVVFIHKDSHKFRNSNNRMSIIKLDYVKVSKLAEISSVIGNIMAYQILKRCRREEILLLKAECFSART